jgi:hypothetical protein
MIHGMDMPHRTMSAPRCAAGVRSKPEIMVMATPMTTDRITPTMIFRSMSFSLGVSVGANKPTLVSIHFLEDSFRG